MKVWDSTRGVSAYFVLFSALLVLVLVLSKSLDETKVLKRYLPDAGMTLLVGIAAGICCLFTFDHALKTYDDDSVERDQLAETLLSFSPEVFMLMLLPPIIFNAGYHLRRPFFFRHAAPIFTLASLGTFISTISIAYMLNMVISWGLVEGFHPSMMELLAFGGLISATDPVSTLSVFEVKQADPQLFYLVAGEANLNDAVGLVLFQTFAKFVAPEDTSAEIARGYSEVASGFVVTSIGSTALGIVLTLAVALLFRLIDFREHQTLELCVYVLVMYVPFLIAELAELSGIVTIFFAGMAANAYVSPNLSRATSSTADAVFRMAAHLAETSIFLELGLSSCNWRGVFDWKFTLLTLLACFLGRALCIYPIAFVFNMSLPSAKKNLLQKKRSGYMSISSSGESSDEAPVACEQKIACADQIANDQDKRIQMNKVHMLWYSGLRGAIAYSCARTFPDALGHRKHFIVTTMAVVLATVFLLGGTTELALKALRIPIDVDEEEYMQNWQPIPNRAGAAYRMDRFIRYYFVRPDNSQAAGLGTSNESPTSDVEDSKDNKYYGNAYGSDVDVQASLTQTVHDIGQHESVYDHGRSTRRRR